MNESKPKYIAIDIAKENLQVQSQRTAFSIAYNEQGLHQLLQYVHSYPNVLLVCEATGGYERKLLHFLYSHNISVALLNPARVRAFARSEGIKAKTDAIDAKMLLRFAQEKQPKANEAPEPVRQELAALMDRRSQLTEQLAREKNRLQKSVPKLRSYIEKMIEFIQEQLQEIDRSINEVIQGNAQMQKQAQIMQGVKGVGETTAWTILAYLREITQLKRNEIVALAGLAPYNRDSGKYRGKRRIEAGRAKVRKCLFMAAQSAAMHNEVIRDYVQGLRQRGKPYKCAIVAAMRKILIHLQSLLKNP